MNKQSKIDTTLIYFIKSSGLYSVFIIIFIFLFLCYFSLPLFKIDILKNLFSFSWNPLNKEFGILSFLLSSLYISGLALLFSIPLSFGISCFILFYKELLIAKVVRLFVKFMTAIPTVIYGFVSIFILVPFIRSVFQYGSGFCILTASIVLSFLIMPTIVLIMTDNFEKVPKKYLLGGRSLGFNQFDEFFYIIIPYCKFGIIQSFILGYGRALGDTMISLMLAGNAVHLPKSIFSSARTLTSHIALVFAESFDSIAFKSIFMSAIILFFIFVILRLLLKSYVDN